MLSSALGRNLSFLPWPPPSPVFSSWWAQPSPKSPIHFCRWRHLHWNVFQDCLYCTFLRCLQALPFPTATPFLPILDCLSKAGTATRPINPSLAIPLCQSIFSTGLSSPSHKTICYTAFGAQCMPELKLFSYSTGTPPSTPTPRSLILRSSNCWRQNHYSLG